MAFCVGYLACAMTQEICKFVIGFVGGGAFLCGNEKGINTLENKSATDVCGDVRFTFAAKISKVSGVSVGFGEAEMTADNKAVAENSMCTVLLKGRVSVVE